MEARGVEPLSEKHSIRFSSIIAGFWYFPAVVKTSKKPRQVAFKFSVRSRQALQKVTA